MVSGRVGQAQAHLYWVWLEPEEGKGKGVLGQPVTDAHRTWGTQGAGPQFR